MDGWDPMQEEYRNSGGRSRNNGPKNSGNTYALYIGNIPMHMNKVGISLLFEKYGKVFDCFTSLAQKRGKPLQFQFGKVVYGSYREAEKAIREMNNTPPLRLKVSFWKSKDEESQSTEGATANAGNGPITTGNTHETRVNRQGNIDHSDPGSKDSYRTAGLAAGGKVANMDTSRGASKVHVDADFVRMILASNAEPTGQTDSDATLNADNGPNVAIPCMMCSAPATDGCRLCWTAYCSRKCQKRHWTQHISQCAQLSTKYERVGLLPDPPHQLKSQEANKVTQNGRNAAINAVAPDCTQANDTRNTPTSSARSNASTAPESDIYPWVKATFPRDARVKAQISHINSPSSFYIQQCDHTKLFEVIAAMQEVEGSGPPVCGRAEFKVGFVVAAEYSDGESKLWYRAKVEKVLPNSMTEILFLDFGNKETVNCNSLRDVPASLKEVPYLAVHCGLFGFSNSDEYPDELIQKFKSMSDGETWVVNVGQENGKLLVRLENSSAAGECINDVFRKDLENNLPFKLKSILEVRKDSSSLSMTMILANENTFWCLGHAEIESDMMLLLDKSKAVKPDKSHREWKVSDFVFATKSCKHSEWYRAQIIDILQDGYKVHCVDYGNVEVVTELAPLEGRFKEIPCLAILCSPRVENIRTGDIINGTLTWKHGEAELTVRNKPGLKLRLRAFNHPDVIKSLQNSAAENPCKVSNAQVEGNLSASVSDQPLNDASIVKVGPKAVSEDYSVFIDQLKDLEYEHLPELTHVDVISVESSTSMYVHALEEIRDDMILLQASLNAFLSENESSMLPVRSLCVGNLVCTKFKDDQMWYRVVVEKIDGEEITVRYVDYGNVDNVSRNCIVAIPWQFLRYPKMAIHVAVAGAQDDIASLFVMKERIFSSKCHPIQMTVVDAHARPVLVHLFTSDGRRVTEPARSSSTSSQDSRNTVVDCKMQNPYSDRKPSDGHAASACKRSPSQSSSVSSKSAEVSTQTMSPNANLQKQLPPANTVASHLKETTAAIPNSDYNVSKANDSPKTASESHLVPIPNKSSETKTYNLENASICTLPVGEELKLTVLEVRSPDIIYFWQPEKQAEALSAMDEEIHKYCSNISEVPKFEAKFGDLCLAKFSASKRWYRGVVMVSGLDESFILFVDYGNMEHVRNFNMVPMIGRFMDLPLQAIHCRLDGCYTDREWTQSILDKVIDVNDMFLVKVVSFDEENYIYSIQIPSLTKQLKGINVLPPDY